MFHSTKTISECGRKSEKEVCKEDRHQEMKRERVEGKMKKKNDSMMSTMPCPVRAIITIHMCAKCDGWYLKQVLKQTHCTWWISPIYYMCIISGFVAASLHDRDYEKAM